MTAEKMMALAVELEAWSRNISDIPWSPWRLETRIKLEKAAKALRASAIGAGEEDIVWRKINDEPFEYAIQQNPLYGDAFVRLLNGKCLRRKTNDR